MIGIHLEQVQRRNVSVCIKTSPIWIVCFLFYFLDRFKLCIAVLNSIGASGEFFFNTPATSAPPIFGTQIVSQAPAFGAAPAFGQTSFGAAGK